MNTHTGLVYEGYYMYFKWLLFSLHDTKALYGAA